MAVALLSPEQLEGVHGRLSIADKNIENLDFAIAEFLKPLPFVEVKVEDGQSIVTESERDAWKRLQQYAKETKVPLAFSIRAGEVIHHLRCCLDHIAWQLADPIKREEKPRQVQFPIIEDWRDPNEASLFERQTQLITHLGAKTLLHDMQPARLNTPKDDFLWIVHHMDILDKHRELAIVLFAPRMQGPSSVTRKYLPVPIKNTYGTASLIPIVGTAKVQANMKISLSVAFAQFGQRIDQPIIKSLTDLTNRIREVVGLFAALMV